MKYAVSRVVRGAARRLFPPPPPDLMTTLVRRDARAEMFNRALEYINFEQVPGDVVECGVFGGISLALLAKSASHDPKGMSRRIVGIDSFEGLPADSEAHARWRVGDCAHVDTHPLLPAGARVSAAAVRDLFAGCGLTAPVLHEGRFDAVLPSIVPRTLSQVALLHIDCDLYESTRDALHGLEPALQDGTVVLFDDWYHYKANPQKGEARAFREFLAAHPDWDAVSWTSYATFCHAFFLVRR